MRSSRLRFELLLALGSLAFSALLLPALVYAVGTRLLGAYADGGLGGFYANLYRDLFSGAWAPLSLLVGPYVVLMLARLPLFGRRRASNDPPAERVEPRIGA